MRKKINISLVLAFILFLTCFAPGSSAKTAKIVGLGHNFVTLDGTAALYANPALVDPDDDVFTLEVGGGRPVSGIMDFRAVILINTWMKN